MVLDVFDASDGDCPYYEAGYQVRLPDYSIVRFYEFELAKREAKNGAPDKP